MNDDTQEFDLAAAEWRSHASCQKSFINALATRFQSALPGKVNIEYFFSLFKKKMVRKISRRTAVNKARRSRVRTFLRSVEEAIASGDKNAAADALKAAQPEMQRAVTKGVFHKNTIARKISRRSARVRTLGA